jgi:hypothetical protein
VSNNNDLDPAASTQMFRAFVEGGTPNAPTPTTAGSRSKSGSNSTGKLIGIVLAVVVVAAIAFVVLH